MWTRTWCLYFVISTYLNSTQYYMMLLAGPVRAHSGKGLGYCYKIGRGPNWCLFGHVTGLLFFLYVNLFLPSIFNSVDFSSSFSCFVLDIELEDKNFLWKLRNFFDGKFQGYSFCPSKEYKPTEQEFWCTINLHGIVWNSGRFDYSGFSNILPTAVNREYSAKRTEKCIILGNLLDKEVEKLENRGCLKVQDLLDE